MLPLDRFREFITANDLFRDEDPILLAVSGGRDSVLMAHFFHQCGFRFGIAHCNFMLRGPESMADERFCRELAGQFGVPHFETRFETREFAEGHHVSIQMAARELRFGWLERIREEHGYRFIATAHHQNDAIETVLLNLVRGTGIAGLHGILPKRDRIIRPLLFLTRGEVDRLAEEHRLRYRDDASNLSTKYARNKIRLEVIPRLRELNPSVEATFEANSRRFAELELLLQETVKAVSARLLKQEGELLYLPVREVQRLNPLHTLLFELLKPYGFTEAVTSDLVRSLPGRPGLTFESETHVLLVDREDLMISLKTAPAAPAVAVMAGDTAIRWQDSELQIRTATVPAENDPAENRAMVDGDLLIFPLTVRSWRTGDYFRPLGMRGRKKLSDFFVSRKVPLIRKGRIPILVNGNGDIIWVAGMRLDDRYKVTPNTKKVYIFELK